MTDMYNQLKIDDLEIAVEKNRNNYIELNIIDATLVKRRPRKRNLLLRERIRLLLNPDNDLEGMENPAAIDAKAYLAGASHSLEERLLNFNINVIGKECPDTDPEKRLLRPDMLERLVGDRPTSREEFTVFIPGYLRTYTCVNEAEKYLDDVLEIIADFESN